MAGKETDKSVQEHSDCLARSEPVRESPKKGPLNTRKLLQGNPLAVETQRKLATDTPLCAKKDELR